MKPIRQQFTEALGYKGKTLGWYRDFALAVLSGIALLFGLIFWMEFRSQHSPFDFKAALICFAVSATCALLATNKVLVLGGAFMVGPGLVYYHAGFTGDWMALAFYFGFLFLGCAILVLGTLAKELWGSSSHRSK